MPRLDAVISKLQVGDNVYRTPEWWNSARKLKKVAKNNEYLKNLKANATFNSSYKVVDVENNQMDKFTSSTKSDLDAEKYAEFAPWNSMYNKFRTLIVFKK